MIEESETPQQPFVCISSSGDRGGLLRRVSPRASVQHIVIGRIYHYPLRSPPSPYSFSYSKSLSGGPTLSRIRVPSVPSQSPYVLPTEFHPKNSGSDQCRIPIACESNWLAFFDPTVVSRYTRRPSSISTRRNRLEVDGGAQKCIIRAPLI